MCFSPIYVLWISQSHPSNRQVTIIALTVCGRAERTSAAVVAGAAADAAAVVGRGC